MLLSILIVGFCELYTWVVRSYLNKDKPILAYEVNNEQKMQEKPHDFVEIQNVESVCDEIQISVDLIA